MPSAQNRSPPLRACHRSSSAPPLAQGRREFLGRNSGLLVLRREDDREVLAEDFGLGVAEDFLGLPVPACDVALRVEREDRVVPDVLDQRREPGFQFPPLVLQPPPLGDVLDGE
jgi:hypothetical protein